MYHLKCISLGKRLLPIFAALCGNFRIFHKQKCFKIPLEIFPFETIQKLQTNKRLYFLLFSPLLSVTAKYRVFAAKVTLNKVFLLYFSYITKLNTFPLFHYVFSPAFYDTCVCISMILCRLKKEHRNTFVCVSVAKIRNICIISNVYYFFLCFCA